MLLAVVIHIHGCPIPGYHTTKIIDQPAKLDSDAPMTFIATFFVNLLRAAACADRENQLDRVAVDHRKEYWISHQQITLLLVSFKQTL